MPRTATQTELLASTKLQIDPSVLRAEPEQGAVILRAPGRARRLVVSPWHAEILTEGFARPATVPEVLVRTIAEQRCPPLREFYELVVQAHAAEILRVVDHAGAESRPSTTGTAAPRTWPFRLPSDLALFFAGVIAAASLAVLAFTLPHWRGPENAVQVIGGWLLVCVLLTLGHFLAAGAVAACGEVRGWRLFWRTRFPHLHADAGEAIVGGRTCEAAVAALRAAPVLAGAAVTALRAPGWFPALCGGALYVLAPFGGTAARQALASRRKAPQYSIRSDFQFAPMREDWWARGVARARAFVAEFGWPGVAWTIVWVAWSVVAFGRCMPRTAAVAKAWIVGAPPPVHLGAEYLLIAVIAVGFVGSLVAALRHWWLRRMWSAAPRGAEARVRDRAPLSGGRAEMLAQVPLFAPIEAALRGAVAAAMEEVALRRGEILMREDEPGDDFYVVIAGELEVRKRLPQSRRSTTIGWLGPGDGVGEIALLEQTTRTATIQAATDARLLRLGRANFDALVVGRIGADAVRESLQQARFLGRFTFAAGWPFADLVRFARRCRTIRAEAGSALITEGEPNHWFFLIFDGAFEARAGARVLRRMGPGDYFGEISLLEKTEATATVVAVEESRCLAIGRTEFLELFARDFRIGLRLEGAAERRLGAPLFR